LLFSIIGINRCGRIGEEVRFVFMRSWFQALKILFDKNKKSAGIHGVKTHSFVSIPVIDQSGRDENTDRVIGTRGGDPRIVPVPDLIVQYIVRKFAGRDYLAGGYQLEHFMLRKPETQGVAADTDFHLEMKFLLRM